MTIDADLRRRARLDPMAAVELSEELVAATLADPDLSCGDIVQEIEELATVHPDEVGIQVALSRALVSRTEDCVGHEADRALARLRQLVAAHPDDDEIKRQLVHALFNVFCDLGDPAALAELRAVAAELPDGAELAEMMCSGTYALDLGDDP